MVRDTAYVDVPTDCDVEPGSLHDEGNIEMQEHGRSRSDLDPTYEPLHSRSTACIFSLGFVIGAISMFATQILYGYHLGDSTTNHNVGTSNMNRLPSDASSANQDPSTDGLHQSHQDLIDAEENEKDAVSYNFLRTSKGSSTISTLLRDLIHPKPEGSESMNYEASSYERLGGPRRALAHLVEMMKDDGEQYVLQCNHWLCIFLTSLCQQYLQDKYTQVATLLHTILDGLLMNILDHLIPRLMQ